MQPTLLEKPLILFAEKYDKGVIRKYFYLGSMIASLNRIVVEDFAETVRVHRRRQSRELRIRTIRFVRYHTDIRKVARAYEAIYDSCDLLLGSHTT
jgi:tRNA isopentenyl-2-thiomethyl-A-37 hydroxylase MiaE